VRVERGVDRRAKLYTVPRAGEVVEVEGGVQLVGPEVTGEALGVGQPDLADEQPRLVIVVRDGAPSAIDVVQLVAVHERVLTRGCV
jgi:hypothetical protein